jgi:hypothetical protein
MPNFNPEKKVLSLHTGKNVKVTLHTEKIHVGV